MSSPFTNSSGPLQVIRYAHDHGYTTGSLIVYLDRDAKIIDSTYLPGQAISYAAAKLAMDSAPYVDADAVLFARLSSLDHLSITPLDEEISLMLSNLRTDYPTDILDYLVIDQYESFYSFAFPPNGETRYFRT